jgi:hypothetical protein
MIKPRIANVEKEESRLDIETLINESLETIELIKIGE